MTEIWTVDGGQKDALLKKRLKVIISLVIPSRLTPYY